MTLWHAGMLALLPVLWAGARARTSWAARAKVHTWVALMVAGCIPWLLPAMAVPAYIGVDAVAGAIVLRRPAGCAQRAIGACFALLVMFHVGFLASYAPGNEYMYYQANTATGWAQFALLAVWGLADAGKAVLHWCRSRLGLLVVDAGIR